MLEAVGLTMGEGVAGLIDHELRTVVDEAAGEGVAVFAGRAEELLAVRELEVAAREGEFEEAEERLRRWEEWPRVREEGLHALEQRTNVSSSLALRPAEASRQGRSQ